MNNIAVINGNELYVKEYEGQRVVTLWDIARLHNVDVKAVKNNFDRNAQYLVENEDYYLLDKDDNLVRTLSTNKEIDYHVLNRSKNIPIFTESGYLMMVKPMTGNLAWSVQRQLVKSYFTMKEVKQIVQNQLDANTALETSKFLVSLADACQVSPEAKLLATKNVFKMAGIELPFNITMEQKLYDLEQIAKRVGILSQNEKPHTQAASEIIKRLNVPDEMKVITFEAKGNWQGSVTKYKEDIIKLVEGWIKSNKYPAEIDTGKKKLKVVYSIAS